MAKHPYLLVMTVELAANGRGDLTHIVPRSESLELYAFRFVATGAFSIEEWDITSGAIVLSNVTPNNPITSTLIQNSANANLSESMFPEPLSLEGGSQMNISLFDTSAALNRVRMLVRAMRNTGQR